MNRGKGICVAVAVVLGIVSILLAILSTVSAQTTIVLLGVALLVLSAGVLQKYRDSAIVLWNKQAPQHQISVPAVGRKRKRRANSCASGMASEVRATTLLALY